jgi:hypothetical protein
MRSVKFEGQALKREVDPRRTRKALRAVRRIAALNEPDPETGEVKAAESFSAWENEFLGEVGQRLEQYGSAFHDLAKGRPEEALSTLQAGKLREIAAKARGPKRAKNGAEKPRKGLQTRKPLRVKRPMRASRHDQE